MRPEESDQPSSSHESRSDLPHGESAERRPADAPAPLLPADPWDESPVEVAVVLEPDRLARPTAPPSHVGDDRTADTPEPQVGESPAGESSVEEVATRRFEAPRPPAPVEASFEFPSILDDDPPAPDPSHARPSLSPLQPEAAKWEVRSSHAKLPPQFLPRSEAESDVIVDLTNEDRPSRYQRNSAKLPRLADDPDYLAEETHRRGSLPGPRN